jgi:hypothetical protein
LNKYQKYVGPYNLTKLGNYSILKIYYEFMAIISVF